MTFDVSVHENRKSFDGRLSSQAVPGSSTPKLLKILQNESVVQKSSFDRTMGTLQVSDIFHSCQFVVDFAASSLLSFKRKQEIRQEIVNNGGILSYILTKQVCGSKYSTTSVIRKF